MGTHELALSQCQLNKSTNDHKEFEKISLNVFFGCGVSSLLCGLFSSCSKQGLLFVVVCGLLTAVTSLLAEHRLWAYGLQ